MQNFQHISAPLRVFGGDKSLGRLNRELTRAGCRRAVVLCGRSIACSPILEVVREAIGDRYAGICDGVRTNSPRPAVEEVTETLERLGADAVIAIGGGSAMVTARAAVILLAESRPLEELCTQRDAQGQMHSPQLKAPKLPLFAIPTTPSTAVVKTGTAIFDPKSASRLALFDPKTRPLGIFVDPAFLMSSPPELVRSAGLNTLSSAIEGLVSKSADPVSHALLMHALRLAAEGLTGLAENDDADRRGNLAMAAILCGRGTDNTGMGLATVISHAVATHYKVDGGVAKAVALPQVLKFNQNHMRHGLDMLAATLGCTAPEVDATITQLFRDLGLPGHLRDLGIPYDGLSNIASKCMTDWFIRSNPRPVERVEDVLGLLEEAW